MNARRSASIAVAAGLAAAALAGCRALPDRSGLGDEVALALVRAEALAIHDLAASVTLSIETADFEGTLDGALVVEPPLRLRLRASKMMTDLFDLLITPAAVELYWFPDRRFFRRRLDAGAGGESGAAPSAAAAATPDADRRGPESFLANLDARALRLSLAGFELPEGELASKRLGCFFGRDGTDFVIWDPLASGEQLERRFDGRSLLLDTATLRNAASEITLVATYDDYELVGTHWIATTATLEQRASGTCFRMTLDEIALNEGALPGAFVLTPPAGCEITEVGEVRQP